jgi:hypothetical protein
VQMHQVVVTAFPMRCSIEQKLPEHQAVPQ